MAWDLQEVYKTRACSVKEFTERYIRFDSMFEMEVYEALVKYFPKQQIGLQVPIQLLSPCVCFPRGKMWRIDFAIYSATKPRRIIRLVEAKGVWTNVFTMNLAILEQYNLHAFDTLDIVMQQVPAKKSIIKNISNSDTGIKVISLGMYKGYLLETFEARHG